MSSFDEEAGNGDGVIVTARHGDNHLKYAEKEYGIQVLNQTIKKNKKYGNCHAAA